MRSTFDLRKIRTMKTISILIAISLATICSAMEDTPENRSIEADRYLVANPPSERVAKMAVVIAKSVPEAHRESFISLMAKNLETSALNKEFKEILMKTYTAGELKALADLYSNPEGKSAMDKQGKYLEATRIPMDMAIRDAMRKTQEQTKPMLLPTNGSQK